MPIGAFPNECPVSFLQLQWLFVGFCFPESGSSWSKWFGRTRRVWWRTLIRHTRGNVIAASSRSKSSTALTFFKLFRRNHVENRVANLCFMRGIRVDDARGDPERRVGSSAGVSHRNPPDKGWRMVLVVAEAERSPGHLLQGQPRRKKWHPLRRARAYHT